MEESTSTSVGTIRSLSFQPPRATAERSEQDSAGARSRSPSPAREIDLASDNDHESVSSLPSVSSSFFFSSAGASPRRGARSSSLSHSESDHSGEHDTSSSRSQSSQGLVIPSLTLPTTLRRPTPHGHALGSIRLLVVGTSGVGKTVLSNLLVEGNDDVVDTEPWESVAEGSIMHASTSWNEQRDAHGLEKSEGSRNVEIHEIQGFDHLDNAEQVIESILDVVQEPFHLLHDVLSLETPPTEVLQALVSSSATPLYTAMIFLLSTPPSPIERLVLTGLSQYIPIIPLPPSLLEPSYSPSLYPSNFNFSPASAPVLSSFRPNSAIALRTGLFRSPDTLALLRGEAAERFLKWREVERAVGTIRRASNASASGAVAAPGRPRRLSEAEDEKTELAPRRRRSTRLPKATDATWSKAEWEASLSEDVARRLRSTSFSEGESGRDHGSGDLPKKKRPSQPGSGPSLDPLHLPSLLLFSLSLLTPLRRRVTRSVSAAIERGGYGTLAKWAGGLGLALVGAFCAGIGFGMAFG